MFALVGSYILSRTLVPTLAKPTCSPDISIIPHRIPTKPWRTRHRSHEAATSWCDFSASSSAGSRDSREGYRELLKLAMSRPQALAIGFLVVVLASMVPDCLPRPELLSNHRLGRDQAALACPAWHPHRGDRQSVRSGRERNPWDDPQGSARAHRRQHRAVGQWSEPRLRQTPAPSVCRMPTS